MKELTSEQKTLAGCLVVGCLGPFCVIIALLMLVAISALFV